MIGLIGGTGLERPPGDGFLRETARTPYGDVALFRGPHPAGGMSVFWSRHGIAHDRPPHRVPYRAGVWALRAAGATHVVATAAVGSVRPDWPPGTLVRVSDGLDQTHGRAATYFDGPPLPVVHLESSALYCAALGRGIAEAAARLGVRVVDGAVLAVTQGPRFETPAEIRALRGMGADLVGMTGFPEVVLARELGMAYAALALVVNPAAGMGGGPIDPAAIDRSARHAAADVRAVVGALAAPGGACEDCPGPYGAPPFPWPVPGEAPA